MRHTVDQNVLALDTGIRHQTGWINVFQRIPARIGVPIPLLGIELSGIDGIHPRESSGRRLIRPRVEVIELRLGIPLLPRELLRGQRTRRREPLAEQQVVRARHLGARRREDHANRAEGVGGVGTDADRPPASGIRPPAGSGQGPGQDTAGGRMSDAAGRAQSSRPAGRPLDDHRHGRTHRRPERRRAQARHRVGQHVPPRPRRHRQRRRHEGTDADRPPASGYRPSRARGSQPAHRRWPDVGRRKP